MVLSLFLWNALANMYAQCGKCEVVNTSSICFPGDTNVGRVAERLGRVSLQPLLELLQLCKLDQWTLYELCYQLIAFGKILKDDTTLDATDIDNSGTIDYGEFLAATEHLNTIVKKLI